MYLYVINIECKNIIFLKQIRIKCYGNREENQERTKE